MNALQVQCIICGAKPGWKCLPAPNTPEGRSGRRLSRPHSIRVEDAAKATAEAEAKERDVAVCAWMLLCDAPSVGTVEHPILGEVEACAGCVERFGLVLTFTPEQLVAEHTGRVSS